MDGGQGCLETEQCAVGADLTGLNKIGGNMIKEEKDRILDHLYKCGRFSQEEYQKAKRKKDRIAKAYWEGRTHAYADCIEIVKSSSVEEQISKNQIAFLF